MQATGRTTLSNARIRLIAAATALVGLVLDQVTKSLAVHHLTPGESRPLIGSLLQLRIIRNPGAAFSAGTGMTAVISCVAIVAACVVTWLIVVRTRDRVWALALGLLQAGILGNVIDRLFRAPSPLKGHVVDFLELPHWPIFNVADCCITVAAVLIVVQAGRGMKLDGTREETTR